jgi:hypothetical protein
MHLGLRRHWLGSEVIIVVICIAEEYAMQPHASSCPVQAVVEPFLKADLSVCWGVAWPN